MSNHVTAPQSERDMFYALPLRAQQVLDRLRDGWLLEETSAGQWRFVIGQHRVHWRTKDAIQQRGLVERRRWRGERGGRG